MANDMICAKNMQTGKVNTQAVMATQVGANESTADLIKPAKTNAIQTGITIARKLINPFMVCECQLV